MPHRPARSETANRPAHSPRVVEYLPPQRLPEVPALVGSVPPIPLGQTPVIVRDWFDDAAAAAIPDHDATLPTARRAALAYARRATAHNTRRAYRAGVRAWCDWCDDHTLPCLPANAADVAAFLAAERGRGRSVTTIALRRAAIRYLHFIAGCAVPTAEAAVSATMAGLQPPPPRPASCRRRSSPPLPRSSARSWPRSAPTWPACATVHCC